MEEEEKEMMGRVRKMPHEREEFSGLLAESAIRKEMKALLQQGPLKRQGSPKQIELKSGAMIDSRKQAEMIRLLQDKKIFASIVVDVDPDEDAEIVVPLCSCAGKAAEHGVATLSIPRGCFLRRVKLRVTLARLLDKGLQISRLLPFLTRSQRLTQVASVAVAIEQLPDEDGKPNSDTFECPVTVRLPHFCSLEHVNDWVCPAVNSSELGFAFLADWQTSDVHQLRRDLEEQLLVILQQRLKPRGNAAEGSGDISEAWMEDKIRFLDAIGSDIKEVEDMDCKLRWMQELVQLELDAFLEEMECMQSLDWQMIVLGKSLAKERELAHQQKLRMLSKNVELRTRESRIRAELAGMLNHCLETFAGFSSSSPRRILELSGNYHHRLAQVELRGPGMLFLTSSSQIQDRVFYRLLLETPQTSGRSFPPRLMEEELLGGLLTVSLLPCPPAPRRGNLLLLDEGQRQLPRAATITRVSLSLAESDVSDPPEVLGGGGGGYRWEGLDVEVETFVSVREKELYGHLSLSLLAARELHIKDSAILPSCFCRVTLDGQQRETKTVKGSHDPVWHVNLFLEVSKRCVGGRDKQLRELFGFLLLEFFHRDLQDVSLPLGRLKLPLADLVDQPPKEAWFPLDDRTGAQVQLRVWLQRLGTRGGRLTGMESFGRGVAKAIMLNRITGGRRRDEFTAPPPLSQHKQAEKDSLPQHPRVPKLLLSSLRTILDSQDSRSSSARPVASLGSLSSPRTRWRLPVANSLHSNLASLAADQHVTLKLQMSCEGWKQTRLFCSNPFQLVNEQQSEQEEWTESAAPTWRGAGDFREEVMKESFWESRAQFVCINYCQEDELVAQRVAGALSVLFPFSFIRHPLRLKDLSFAHAHDVPILPILTDLEVEQLLTADVAIVLAGLPRVYVSSGGEEAKERMEHSIQGAFTPRSSLNINHGVSSHLRHLFGRKSQEEIADFVHEPLVREPAWTEVCRERVRQELEEQQEAEERENRGVYHPGNKMCGMYLRGGSVAGEENKLSHTPCIGNLQGFEVLEKFYSTGEGNEVFRRKLSSLRSVYGKGFRAVKGDGNCFIRGYMFAVLQSLLSLPRQEASGFKGILTAYNIMMLDKQLGLGYSGLAVSDFYEDMLNEVTLIEEGSMTEEMLEDNFNLLSFSNSLVTFTRLVCSCYIQQHPQHFAPFLGIDTSDTDAMKREVRDFCLREVEPLEREVDQVQIIALTSAFGFGVRVAHLDRSDGPLNFHGDPPISSPLFSSP
ncbi:hypothetical protein GUITHDRAFT_120854 [Guillardia theta CCMP2712]|uniref:ubiquitinyl hydrolase 1 n=1 Tax=Guillardia theta (strain CCMP2712) TaxID=905079 RepID=L1I9P6_GUITC|nr:hypothetical protein GUITHDRAFT_120854 [Guillardia theta CCMP2712]EKX32976.1 hypothetical protein GUITHDRAFT_120854 [Guillardia theta CCMP2712]|eukprot:XP_005819956.1 hypothetical protein GUITHDRAFT_120854 [Guillardia theta CCMP2712]